MNESRIIAQNPKNKEELHLVDLNTEALFAYILDEELRRTQEFDIPKEDYQRALTSSKNPFEALVKVFQSYDLGLELLDFEAI